MKIHGERETVGDDMDDIDEVAVFIFAGACMALGFFAQVVSGGSWVKGGLIVIAVALPLVMLTDISRDGFGFSAWMFIPVGFALGSYFMIFFDCSGSGANGGGGSDGGDAGDVGSGE